MREVIVSRDFSRRANCFFPDTYFSIIEFASSSALGQKTRTIEMHLRKRMPSKSLIANASTMPFQVTLFKMIASRFSLAVGTFGSVWTGLGTMDSEGVGMVDKCVAVGVVPSGSDTTILLAGVEDTGANMGVFVEDVCTRDGRVAAVVLDANFGFA